MAHALEQRKAEIPTVERGKDRLALLRAEEDRSSGKWKVRTENGMKITILGSGHPYSRCG